MSVLTRDTHTLRFHDYLIDRALNWWELTPLRMTAIYLLFGTLALYFSDVYLVRQFSEPFRSQLQAVKGGVEVLVTAGLIFGLTRAKAAQVQRSEDRANRQNEELLVLHRVLRHNLRNKLNIVMGIGEAVQGDSEDADRRRGRLLAKTAREMLHYTEQAARIRRVTANGDTSSTVNLTESVPQIVEGVTDDEAVDVTVDVPEGVSVRVNRMFPEAIEELLTNALDQNDSDEPWVRVTVDPTAGPLHHVEISVADNGPGIPAAVVSVLKSSERDQLSHLQGMGLWFVYWVVAESDGHMVIETPDDGGTAVRVRVPSAQVLTTERFDEVLSQGMELSV